MIGAAALYEKRDDTWGESWKSGVIASFRELSIPSSHPI